MGWHRRRGGTTRTTNTRRKAAHFRATQIRGPEIGCQDRFRLWLFLQHRRVWRSSSWLTGGAPLHFLIGGKLLNHFELTLTALLSRDRLSEPEARAKREAAAASLEQHLLTVGAPAGEDSGFFPGASSDEQDDEEEDDEEGLCECPSSPFDRSDRLEC